MPRSRARIEPDIMQMRTFADFWPFYVRAHSRPLTRVMHAIGSTLALVCIVLGFTTSAWFFLAAPVIGYAFAWTSHFFVEHNKPATFGHPFWSFAADYVMLWKTVTGSMRDEIAKASTSGTSVPRSSSEG